MALPAERQEDWLVRNQRSLQAALFRVQAALEQHAYRMAHREVGVVEARPAVQELSSPQGSASSEASEEESQTALDALCAAYDLTPFERDTLLLCAGVELDGTFPSLCAAAQGLSGRALPTFGLALAALPDAHWSAITPQGALRRGCLLQVLPGDSLVGSPLRIAERVLHYLTGLLVPEERLHTLLRDPPPPDTLSGSQAMLVKRLSALLQAMDSGQLAERTLLLCGANAHTRQAVAAAACAGQDLALHVLPVARVPSTLDEQSLFCRLWERETMLGRCALLLSFDEQGSSAREQSHAAYSLLDELSARRLGPLLVSSRDPLYREHIHFLRLDVPHPSVIEQRALWQQALRKAGSGWNGQHDRHLDRILSHFSLDQRAIETASNQLAVGLAEKTGDVESLAVELFDTCRKQSRGRMDDLAQRIISRASFADLVLPEAQLKILRSIVAHKRHQVTVREHWGFAEKCGRGLGLAALFIGSSGTGKTLAAEVVANELQLDLYRIDLSQVVSKYIGETEKNLRRVFDAAEESGAVLLFDEADALFGKRSEVKDSHDRYANIEVSYLLQRMEAYQGVSILTTNMKSSLDQAFLRRLRFVLHFPFPDPAQRSEIWRRVFPPSAPLDGVDIEKLARLNVAGGHIRNIALSAAFLAAESEQPLRMGHLLAAARAEYDKQEKPLTESEIRGWV